MKSTTKRISTGIVQRGKSYQFTVSLGYNMERKQIRKTCTFHPPDGVTSSQAKSMAQEEYYRFKNRCKGNPYFNENMKFSQLVEEYQNAYMPNCLKPITAYCYQNHIAYHLLPHFGNASLGDITPSVLTHFFQSHKTFHQGKWIPLSYTNARRIYGIMQSIFHFAVTQNYIRTSPCRNVILPHQRQSEKAKPPLTKEESQQLISYFSDDTPTNTMIKFLLLTGMRVGECLGLQWNDIDFQKSEIHIRNNLSNVGGKFYLTTPKTESSRRTIILGKKMRDLLLKHQINQKQRMQNYDGIFPHPELVFTTQGGNYKDRGVLNRSFKNRLKDTPYSHLTLHSLRHCNATLLLNEGVDIKIVSEHLGHASIGVMGNIYADVLRSSKVQTAILIEECFL